MHPAIRGAIRLFLLFFFSLQIERSAATISIEIQPGTESVAVGEHVVLGAIVVTTAGEVIGSYQWFMSPTSGGPFTMIAQGGSLVLDNIQVTNSGYYFAKVLYQAGGVPQNLSSETIQLTVDVHARVLTQPLGGYSEPGSNATFSITAAGTPPLSFQWRQNNGNLSDGVRITGANSTNLAIQNLLLTDTGDYDVVVANAFGSTTSHVAVLNVAYVLPVITSPTNSAGKQGHAFNFPIAATGTPLITFGAEGLPNGLSLNATNGLISGIPAVAGIFGLTLYATNGGATTITNLTLSLANDTPVIISATNATGKQGYLFNYAMVATNDPAWYDAGPLPTGLSVNHASGIISGTPLVSGPFSIPINVTNLYGSATQTLNLSLASGAPLITSALTKNGKQGQSFSYTIQATNNPATYSAVPLPTGLSIDPISGVISGIPLVTGTFPVTIGSFNVFGSDSQTLTITLASGAPAITSSLTANGTEEGAFSYTIKGNNTPTSFLATSLPIGLTVNTNTGAVTGIPLYAGDYHVPIFAANAWGVGSNTLHLTVNNLAIDGLSVTNVRSRYFSPYLLEFTFSLRDSADPLTSRAVVAAPSLLSVTAFENQVPVSPSETGVILKPGASKVLKGYLVLDFTASVASIAANGDADHNGISDAVDAEIASAQVFVNQQPAGSQIGVYEFHRDDEAPQQVSPLTTDKAHLTAAIGGIWTNYVQGFPAASRAWDALGAAVSALGNTNIDETHYVVFMSDGQDDSSTNTLNNVMTAAAKGAVEIYTVGFGAEEDASTLQNISSTTLGRFYDAGTDISALPLSFARIGKDLSSQYILRWATLKRSATSFLPTFQITYQGFTAPSPGDPPPFISGTNFTYETNMSGDIATNSEFLYTTNYTLPPFTATTNAGNVLGGFLRLAPDADVNPQHIALRAVYVPRYIRQLNVHYRANWPVTLSLNTTNTGGLLDGWSLMQTNDGVGGQWAVLNSPDPSNLASSIPFASFGNLLTFSFPDPITASNAFSSFAIDNTIYTNTAGTNFYGFNLTNTASFITLYPTPPAHGTPIPWLISYGFTNNFDAAELLDPNGNGFTVWQDYLAGLNPTNTNSFFGTGIGPAQGQGPPQISFNTVVGRNYRVEWSTGLFGPWNVLRDGIPGTGGLITFTDQRNLSTAGLMYYRVAVAGP
jgi:hypothetical protein